MATKSGLASLSEGRSDLLKIDPRKLHVKRGWNTRDMNDPSNVDHVDMLAKSIAEIGVKVPLICYWEDGKAYVSSGHCRLAATMQAIEVLNVDIKTVPVIIDDRYANEADRILGQVIHNQGKPFSGLEQAKVFKKLLDLGWQQGDIAKKAGLSQGRVSQILEYLTLPAPVQAMVTAGNVSPTLAVQTVKNSASGTAAEVALKAGLEAAKAEGKDKIKPAHLEGTTVPNKPNIRTVIHEALDSSDVDDDAEEFIVIKMPTEQWKKLRESSGW